MYSLYTIKSMKQYKDNEILYKARYFGVTGKDKQVYSFTRECPKEFVWIKEYFYNKGELGKYV